jgi:hypothetical protein
MTKHLLGLELPHWLIIAGSVLILLGLLGIVVRRREQPSPTPGEAASVDDQVRMPWHQSRETGAGHQSDKS